MDYSQTLNQIVTQLHKLGDLPVFSATVNQIRQISVSEEADAMALAMAVMKDVNLSVRVLKLANTPLFNPNKREIASLSRAVVLLGFERILNLAMTLKLVESLRTEQQDKALDQLLVHAFLNAAISRELAEAAQLRKSEGVYLNGLLHNLGEILVAYTLPAVYGDISTRYKAGESRWSSLQLSLLGAEFSDIGQEFGTSWGFPKPLVLSMDSYTANKLEGSDRRAHQIAVGSSAILAKLYNRGDDDGKSLVKLLAELSEALDIRADVIENAVHQGYKLAAHLAEEVDLPTASLKPAIDVGDDEPLQDLAGDIAFYLHSRDQKHRAERSETPLLHVAQPPQPSNVLKDLADFNTLINSEAPATQLVEAMLKAVLSNTQFERALFMMLSANPVQLTPRLASGHQLEVLKGYFTQDIDSVTRKLMLAITTKSTPLLVPDLTIAGWRERLPRSLINATAAHAMLMASLHVAGKPLGLFYFDRISGPLDDADFAAFNQFMLLLTNVLERRASARR